MKDPKKHWPGLRILIFSCSLFLFILAGISFGVLPASAGQALSISDRLACRLAIEQVYWLSSDWPEANPEPRPALEMVLSGEQLADQTDVPLAQTMALQARWNLNVTGEMLQAELDRMAAGSKDPERLRVLFAALDEDPARIAECLVRPVLVERLIRTQYANDPALHTPVQAQAAAQLAAVDGPADLAALPGAQTLTWRVETGEPALAPTAADGAVPLSAERFTARLEEIRQAFGLQPEQALPLDLISPLQENAGEFYSLAVLESSPDRLTVVYMDWPKQTFESWWAEQAAGYDAADFRQPAYSYRLPSLTGDAPTAGPDAWEYLPAIPWATTTSQSVWTGSVMLVWGGGYTTNGFRYDPILDDWRPITTLNAPEARHSFTAVWTGSEMIVYGGCDGTQEFCTTGSGGRYNPATDTWLPIAYGVARRQHTAVWTGSEMLVWGGCTEDSNGNQNCNNLIDQGGRYNPTTDAWSPMTMSGAPGGARNPGSVWADDQMILWNGVSGVNARYFPGSDSWQSISSLNAPEGFGAPLIWTGSEMIAWGGCSGINGCPTLHNTGGRYDPAADSWEPTSIAGAPAARSTHSAVWTGSAMIVWGGWDGQNFLSDGGQYDPASDSWTPVSALGAPSARSSQFAHWTGQAMVVWGGMGYGDERVGGRYDPAGDSWQPTTNNDPYRNAVYHATIWDGSRMISWGGEGEQFIDPFYQRARLYDPALDTWEMSSENPNLGYYWWPAVVWTGTEMIIWGGQYGSSITDLGARYNPFTDTWQQTSLANAPEARGSHSAVWTGTEMVVWGGSTWSDLTVETGGRYNPQTNSWTATALSGAPSGRYFHAAAWTGSEMLIWGGQTATGATNTGARYTPGTDSWTALPLSGAPAGRVMFTSVWTGTEFIVWGGGSINSGWTFFQGGGRYHPGTDSWTPTSLVDAPTGRARLASVWTGSEMIVWGGCDDSNCLHRTHTGGRYDPAADAWTATTTDHVIEGREFHTMVWTGSDMIVWGGETEENQITHTGGRYLLEQVEWLVYLPLVSRP